MKRGEARDVVERIIARNEGRPATMCSQIMELIDEIVADLERRGRDDSDQRSLDEVLGASALGNSENVYMHEI